MRCRLISWFLSIALWRQRSYRLVDQIFVIHLLAIVYRVIRTTRAHWIPKFVRKSAMGIDTVFR